MLYMHLLLIYYEFFGDFAIVGIEERILCCHLLALAPVSWPSLFGVLLLVGCSDTRHLLNLLCESRNKI